MDKFIVRVRTKDLRSGADTTASTSTEEEGVPEAEPPPKKANNKGKRNFQIKWTTTYPWLMYDEEKDIVLCKVCHDAYKNKLLTFSTKKEMKFINEGFQNWQKALEKFSKHEKSCCHSESMTKSHTQLNCNISCQLVTAKSQQMNDSRTALVKIISTLRYLAIQGLAIRGQSDELSNMINLLQLRCEDCPVLKQWLAKDSYKWLSHDISNEILNLMSHKLLRSFVSRILDLQYYAILMDETSDIAVKEQVSICFRFVSNDLTVSEIFFGFYETESTTSKTLFDILIDVLHRFNFPIKYCRGQCYDGAANMSGAVNGLRSQVQQLEPRAIYVHCLAHSLNLVIQESVRLQSGCRNCLNTTRELINFVKNSPKRLSLFSHLQTAECTNLRPFCPTRWTIRFVSLNSVLKNYSELIRFMHTTSETDKSDAGAKANGFLVQLQSFDFFFHISLLVQIFSHVDATNTALQKQTLSFKRGVCILQSLRTTLQFLRESFPKFWAEVTHKSATLTLHEPELPRKRIPPQRLDSGSISHVHSSPEEMYRKIFYEMVDNVVSCLDNRSETVAADHLEKIERLLTGCLHKCDEEFEYIMLFYGDDVDGDRLLLHRDMMLDIAKSKMYQIIDFQSVLDLLRKEEFLRDMLPELVKFVRIVLTIPVSTCTAERSFSSLRRLKSYTRSTMGQQRLNSVSILHSYREEALSLDLDEIANEFISRNEIRRKTFAFATK